MRKQVLRAFLSTLILLVLTGTGSVLPGFQLLSAQAAAPTLVISEINWAGSPTNTNDEWIELYNSSGGAINFANTPYKIFVGGLEQILINGTTLAVGERFLISKLNPTTDPTSTLNPVSGAPDLIVPTLSLPNQDAKYELKNSAGEVIDVADDGVGAPMAGSDGATGAMIKASMSRVSLTSDGSLPGSWFTPQTIGSNFRSSVGTYPNAAQFGTPFNSKAIQPGISWNPELALPSNLAVTPLNPTSPTPTVSGNVIGTPDKAIATSVTLHFTSVDKVGETTFSTPVKTLDSTFSGTTTPLPAGIYRLAVNSQDVPGNRSYSVPVPIPEVFSPQGLYVVNSNPVIVNPPILDPYPSLVNTSHTVTTPPVLNLSGRVDIGIALVISINGTHIGEDALLNGRTTFNVAVTLTPNAVNKVEVRARDAAGNTSLPAIAVITHDSIAPVLNKSLVKVNSALPGSIDSIMGLAGATDPGTRLELFADEALTKLLADLSTQADGSFGSLNLGDNLYGKVYIRLRDAAGNISVVSVFDNPITFANTGTSLKMSVSGIRFNQVVLHWEVVPGAVNYRLKYKAIGGQYSAVMDLCSLPVSQCGLERTLINLTPNTEYTLALAAVDQFGNQSNFTELSLRTLAAGVGGVSSTSPLPKPGSQPTSSPTSTTSGTGSTGTTGGSPNTGGTDQVIRDVETSPTPAPTPTPEGKVKSAEDTARNWTPWIILAVLVGLAVLATAGYFYWFGGEAGEDALASALAERERRQEDGDEDKGDNSSNSPPKKPGGGGKSKRW